jgi:hypothetical protein
VPGVIATDARHWLLTRGFEEVPLAESTDADLWTRALRRYSEMQAALAGEYAELIMLGCPLRQVSTLKQQVRLMLDDTAALQLDEPRGLTTADHQALLELRPAFEQAADELLSVGLPNTLEHGDLHGHNIAVTPAGGFIYFDWTDGCLTQPLLGLAAYVERAPAELHPALYAAYLEPWRAYADDAKLQRALRPARVLSALHLAWSYYNIRRLTEPRQRWELAGALAFVLREAFKHQRET